MRKALGGGNGGRDETSVRRSSGMPISPKAQTQTIAICKPWQGQTLPGLQKLHEQRGPERFQLHGPVGQARATGLASALLVSRRRLSGRLSGGLARIRRPIEERERETQNREMHMLVGSGFDRRLMATRLGLHAGMRVRVCAVMIVMRMAVRVGMRVRVRMTVAVRSALRMHDVAPVLAVLVAFPVLMAAITADVRVPDAGQQQCATEQDARECRRQAHRPAIRKPAPEFLARQLRPAASIRTRLIHLLGKHPDSRDASKCRRGQFAIVMACNARCNGLRANASGVRQGEKITFTNLPWRE